MKSAVVIKYFLKLTQNLIFVMTGKLVRFSELRIKSVCLCDRVLFTCIRVTVANSVTLVAHRSNYLYDL